MPSRPLSDGCLSHVCRQLPAVGRFVPFLLSPERTCGASLCRDDPVALVGAWERRRRNV